MRKVNNTTITRYKDGNFWIDIIETPDMYEAMIQHKEYGDASLMFGAPKKQPILPDMTLDVFLDMVERNLDQEKKIYMDQYGED